VGLNAIESFNQNQLKQEDCQMERKTIATVMLVSIISAGTLFAGPVNASEANRSLAGTSRTANNASFITPGTQLGLALVTFENYTPWTVQCFIDGQFRGVVLPMHSLSIWTGSGYTVLSAQANFVNATPAIWNSGLLFYYPGGNYSWRLAP
jgi:hypothetical protein